jgi:TrmH family RNA methyltransferase
MGAIFRVNVIVSSNIIKTLKELKKHKFKILATSLETSNNIYDIDYHKKVLIIGNEANGISKEVLALADETAKIPMLRKNRKPKRLGRHQCYSV